MLSREGKKVSDIWVGGKKVQFVIDGNEFIYGDRRLIEGVDYERYDWLIASNPTMLPRLYVDDFSKGTSFFKIKFRGLFSQIMDNAGIKLNKTGPTLSLSGLGKAFSLKTSYKYDEIEELEVNLKKYYSDIEISDISNRTSKIFYLFYTSPYSHYESYTKQALGYYEDEHYKLYPCKLLRPITKYSNKQGYARSINQSGFIDLNSGIFYGRRITNEFTDAGNYTATNELP